MAGQLRHAQRCGADSAGNTRPPPPQPRVYRRSDADHIMPGIVRRQAAGGLGADPGQAVRMGLAATGSICALLAGRVAFGLCRRSVCTYAKRMRMARHLGFREGRGADSAGKSGQWLRRPRQPPATRGSQNAPRSTAAGCRQPRN